MQNYKINSDNEMVKLIKLLDIFQQVIDDAEAFETNSMAQLEWIQEDTK